MNPQVCKNCGSEEVETKMWVNINTEEIGDSASDISEIEDNWCNNCEDHCEIINQSEYIDNIVDETDSDLR